MRSVNKQTGFTLTELLVTISILGVVFGGLMHTFTSASQGARDHSIRVAADVHAQALVQTIIGELRVLGNGLPFDQSNFEIGEITLSDPSVTEPLVVANCNANQVSFRLNETGNVMLLAADFDPALGSDIQLTSVEDLGENDPIYLSNNVVSGDDGLYATISSIDTATNTITLNADVVASPGATFPIGSVMEVAPVVTYFSDGTVITRDSGLGAVTMAENATLTLEYLDWNLNPLPSVPFTNSDVINLLRAIRVTVQIDSDRTLSTGQGYTAQVSQVVGLRNLNFLY